MVTAKSDEGLLSNNSPLIFLKFSTSHDLIERGELRFHMPVDYTREGMVVSSRLPNLTNPEVCTLFADDFSNLSALKAAASATAQPTLLVVDPNQVAEVLVWLTDKDDICLKGSPAQFIDWRADRLKDRLMQNQDALTGLLARQHFEQRLSSRLENASTDQPVSLILCDIDYFKKINDDYGHAAGDKFLVQFANILRTFADRSSEVGRIGGEEFGIVCDRDLNTAMMLAEKLREQTNRLVVEDGISTTASFGIAWTAMPTPSSELMQQANQANYAAKANGRDQCVSYQQLEADSRAGGQPVEMLGLQHQARVMAERVANIITMRSRNLLSAARKEADVDGLTGCFTRRYLDRRLQSEFQNREENPLSVAFLDLDHFGQVNKQYGWLTGDKLLRDVCNTIRVHIRKDDWVGRYGGEEFCLVMPNTDIQQATEVLLRIREVVEYEVFQSQSDELVTMTLSIGAAIAQPNDVCFQELLDRASHQALLAKRQGRNRVCVA